MMRASRLLSILMLLQTRGRLTAPALSVELEVSQRTILRDIDHLSAAGVPVYADRGRDGGFQLREDWSTNLTGLTEDEAQALFLAGLPTAAAELGLGNASASARLKMLAALPEALRSSAEQVNARLHFDPIDWFRGAVPVQYLQAMAHCVWHQHEATMDYESWQGTKQRLIKPLGLVLKAGIWYVVALADASAQPRTYRLSNIHQLKTLNTTFSHPERFNLAAFWRLATQRFEADIYTGTAQLRVSKSGMKRLSDLSATVAQAARKTAVADPDHDGWWLVIVPIESHDHAAGQMLSMGAGVQVLEPPALRLRMKVLLETISAFYL